MMGPGFAAAAFVFDMVIIGAVVGVIVGIPAAAIGFAVHWAFF